jgi:hypothetical protein
MDEIDEIRHRLRISKLEAMLALRQIEASALTREIRSSLTPSSRKEQATDLRDAAHAESAALQADLNALRKQFPYLARH